MLIDKSKFMVLVAAISATTGCLIVDADGEGGTAGEGPGPTTGGGGTGAGASGGGGAGGDGGTGGVGGDLNGGGGAGGSETCLGDRGTPDACSSECEAMDGVPGISNCDGVPNVKAGVGVEVVTCVNALDPATCSAFTDGFQGCFLANLALACHDPAVEAPCSAIATACGTIDDAAWQAECSAVLSGLTEEGRTRVSSCMETGCADGFTLENCATNVYYDAPL
jgi:hypothetical protein